jgi:carbamoyltransferase
MKFPHSVGLLYSAFTAYLGFEVNDAEYKVMGMAAYGSPAYRDRILRELVHLNKDGTIRLNMQYFPFLSGKKMFNSRWEKLFGIPARTPEGGVEKRHYDIAASMQNVLEEIVLTMAIHVRVQTGMRDLCLAGGIALNSVCNGRLLREAVFERFFVQPAAGDAGAALGAAYAAYHLYLGKKDRHPPGSMYLGPSYPVDDALVAGLELERHSVTHRQLDEKSLMETAARLLADGKVLGWYQGRMEFGPRALGNRSILADPRRKSMKDTVNRMVKFREEFRPFAPVVTCEDARRFFDMENDSPYMLLTFPVKADTLPAVTHADGSARVQTVTAGQNPMLYALLKAFERLSGIPVLLNTSLNVRGEAIACSPQDAVRCFLKSGMDALVLGQFLIEKQR